MRIALVLVAVVLGAACAYTTQQWMEAKTKVEVLESTASMYRDMYDEARQEATQLREEAMAAKTAQKRQFAFYYALVPSSQHSVIELQNYLAQFNAIRDLYSVGTLDCSEMSAFLEWCLENAGFSTKVVTKTSFGNGGGHAWLWVQTATGEYPVEATVPTVVNPSYDAYEQYTKADHVFEDINEALLVYPDQFDWWNS